MDADLQWQLEPLVRRVPMLPVAAFIVHTACVPSVPSLGPRPCPSPALPVAGWPELLSRYGVFSIRLPPPAGEHDVRCFDSPCGRFRTKNWLLEYDMGHFAGPGTAIRFGQDVRAAGSCDEDIGGRRAHIATGRYGPAPANAAYAGQYTAGAAFELLPGSGFYLSVTDSDSVAIQEFLAAIRTIRFHEPSAGQPR